MMKPVLIALALVTACHHSTEPSPTIYNEVPEDQPCQRVLIPPPPPPRSIYWLLHRCSIGSPYCRPFDDEEEIAVLYWISQLTHYTLDAWRSCGRLNQ